MAHARSSLQFGGMQIGRRLKLLIVDGYDAAGVAALSASGAVPGHARFEELFRRAQGFPIGSRARVHTETEVLHLGLYDDLPSDSDLKRFDGVAWTGSNLTIYESRPEIKRQIELARTCYKIGVPQFGSCWGMQLAAYSAGIPCERNPRGREQGLSNTISLTDQGTTHPMYHGKDMHFTGTESHYDHVSATWAAGLTSGPRIQLGHDAANFSAQVLSGNAWSPVQGLEVRFQKGTFWGTQYHTELGLADIAKVTRVHAQTLVDNGTFKTTDLVHEYVAALEHLDVDPDCVELRGRVYDLTPGSKPALKDRDLPRMFGLLDRPEQNLVESSNWLYKQVLPYHLEGESNAMFEVPTSWVEPREIRNVAQTRMFSSGHTRNRPLASIAPETTSKVGVEYTPSASDLASDLGWDIVPVADALGAELRGADLRGLHKTNENRKQDSLAAIKAALLEHQVIFFRDQAGFAPQDHLFLAKAFGSLQDTHPAYPHVEGYKEITILENDKEKPSLIERWHTDMTFRPSPPLGSILHGVVTPTDKGDTEFLSLAAAYEALPPSKQEFLAGLQAEHSFEHGFQESLAAPGGRERLTAALVDNPPVIHPVVRTHPESGRQGLFVNGLFTTRIVGMEREESVQLLKMLYAWIENEQFRCRFAWKPDSVAFWDNRITQHRPVNDYWPSHRKLQRITIDGDRPFYSPTAAISVL